MMWQARPSIWPNPSLLLTNRNLIGAGVLLTAVFFIANGIHILATGRWLLSRPADPSKSLPYVSRIVLGVFYVGTAAILVLLVSRLL